MKLWEWEEREGGREGGRKRERERQRYVAPLYYIKTIVIFMVKIRMALLTIFLERPILGLRFRGGFGGVKIVKNGGSTRPWSIQKINDKRGSSEIYKWAKIIRVYSISETSVSYWGWLGEVMSKLWWCSLVKLPQGHPKTILINPLCLSKPRVLKFSNTKKDQIRGFWETCLGSSPSNGRVWKYFLW